MADGAPGLYKTAMRSKPPSKPPHSGPPGSRPPNPANARPPRYGSGEAPPGAKRPPSRGFTPRGARTEAVEAPSRPSRPPPRDRASGPRPARAREPDETPRLGQARPARVVAAPARVEPPRPDPDRVPRPILRAPQPEPAPERAPREAGAGKDAPRGSVWLHGLHPVAAALANSGRRAKRLLLTEEAEKTLAERLPQPWPLPTERTERAKLDALLGRDTVHQGAALLADLLPPPVLSVVLERPGPVLVLDQVTDPRNVGAVLRSAAAFGACCVITQDRNAPEETGVLAKAASGALEVVPMLRAVNLARTLVALKAAGFWVVGLDSGGAALRGDALRERRVALVLGAEGAGLRRLTRDTCDEVAGLAMPGGMESLNVSAAATVALYELTRG